MSGRRRHDRFEITDPWVGSLRLLREVIVKTAGAGHLVISRTALPAGEVMRLGLGGATKRAALRVRVADSWPMAFDGSVRYAARLEVLRGRSGRERQHMHVADVEQQPDNMRDGAETIGVLTRDVPVHLRNVSGSGCLLESATAIDEGIVARVRMLIGNRRYGDDVRVIRCRRVEGAGATHYIGVEFAWATRPWAASLRAIVSRLPGFTLAEAVVPTHGEAV